MLSARDSIQNLSTWRQKVRDTIKHTFDQPALTRSRNVQDKTHYEIVPPDREAAEKRRMTKEVSDVLPRWIKRKLLTLGYEYTNLKEKCTTIDDKGARRLTCFLSLDVPS